MSVAIMEPMSPLTPSSEAVRRRSLAQPAWAVVHQPDLRNLSPAYGNEATSTANAYAQLDSSPAAAPLVKRRSMMTNNVSAPTLKLAGQDGEMRPLSQSGMVQPLSQNEELRPLSQHEVIHRSKVAVSHFRTAAKVNSKARTIEDMDMTMSKIRQMREKDGEQPEKNSKPAPPVKKATIEEVKEEEEEPNFEPQKLSLAEKMGHGVKTKTAEGRWSKLKSAVEATAAIAPARRRSSFAAVAAGGGDGLMARLAAKREALQQEMNSFESMDLSIPEFISTFRSNANLVDKVAQTTRIPAIDLKSLDDAELEKWFVEMDTDGSGTLDFREFINGIMKMTADKEKEKAGNDSDQKVARATNKLSKRSTY